MKNFFDHLRGDDGEFDQDAIFFTAGMVLSSILFVVIASVT